MICMACRQPIVGGYYTVFIMGVRYDFHPHHRPYSYFTGAYDDYLD